MPIKQSAKKAAKQSLKRKAVNSEFKVMMKDATKAVKKLIANGEVSSVLEALVHAQKRIDKAAKRNIISKESAGRKKSNLMKAVAWTWVDTATPSTEKKAVAKKAPAKKTVEKQEAAKKAPAKKTTKK